MERKIEVGMRFIRRSSKAWTDGGKTGMEVVEALCEVTKVENGWMDYRTVEVLSVEDAPSFYQPPGDRAINLNASGLEKMIAKGWVRFL